MKDAFNPTKRPWNAVGDGVTGDTATYDTIAMHNTIAIQKCLDAAKTKHKDVYIPAGTYLVSGPLTIPSGLAVYGDGPGDDGTILLHQPASAGVDLLHLNEATDVHISGLCLKSRHENSRHAIHAYRVTWFRVQDVRVSHYQEIPYPWKVAWNVGLWLERGLQNEFCNVTIEDCSQACLYFHYVPGSGQGRTTTQLFQNCRFRQGMWGIIAEDAATITTRFIGCTVETCHKGGVKTTGECTMTWIDPHVENVPSGIVWQPPPFTIFDLGPRSILHVTGGWLGGTSKDDWSDTSIFSVNDAKSISLNGVTFHRAAKVFEIAAPPEQLVVVGAWNEDVKEWGDLKRFRSLHIEGWVTS